MWKSTICSILVLIVSISSNLISATILCVWAKASSLVDGTGNGKSFLVLSTPVITFVELFIILLSLSTCVIILFFSASTSLFVLGSIGAGGFMLPVAVSSAIFIRPFVMLPGVNGTTLGFVIIARASFLFFVQFFKLTSAIVFAATTGFLFITIFASGNNNWHK